MKFCKSLSLFLLGIIFLIIGGSATLVNCSKIKVPSRVGVPESLKIETDSSILGILEYEDFYLAVRRILTRVGAAYCLEDNKDYPTGEVFEVEGKVNEDIARVLTVGYPCKSAEELGLKSKDDAYLATQIAIWSINEGYSVYDFRDENKDVLKAIINIYENSKSVDLSKVEDVFIEYYLNDSLQRIVVKM